MTRAWVVASVLAVAALGACGEKPQTTASGAKKSDTRAYEGGQGPYAASGWKNGDRAGWEEQMRVRVQNQNEYLRTK